MPRTWNPKKFDVVVLTREHRLAFHIGNRATRAGAIGPAMGMVKGKDRDAIEIIHVQPCPGVDHIDCWFEQESDR